MQGSILDYLPPPGDRKSYRLYASLALEEAAALESFVVNPLLPFGGDMTTIIRTFVRAGIAQLAQERQEAGAFITSLTPVLGSELLRWSSSACDNFATSATEHLTLALDSGNVDTGVQVVESVGRVLEDTKHTSAKLMLRSALVRRGFTAALERLRSVLLEEDKDVYWLDTFVAERFG